MFGYRQFGSKPNNFGPNCPKSERFCLICPITSTSDFGRKNLSEIRTKSFGQIPKTELSGTGPKVNRPRTEVARIMDADCTIVILNAPQLNNNIWLHFHFRAGEDVFT